MDNFQDRKLRTLAINKRLKKLFPRNNGTALKHKNPWQLLVAVMLSAQCTDKKVNEVTNVLFKKYRTLTDYAKVSQKEFEKDVRPTGFYRNKAKNILSSAKKIKKEYGGSVPFSMDELLTLPGVARKTANVVLSNAFGKIEGIAVDTHVRRFAIRFELSASKNPETIEKEIMLLLPKSEWFGFSNRLIEYGRTICPARKHDCSQHPLTKLYPKANRIWPRAH